MYYLLYIYKFLKDVINILIYYSSITIMQQDGIHAIIKYAHQAYVAIVIKVTHDIFLQF